MGRKKVAGSGDKGKTRVELRFDDDVYRGIRDLADRTEVSVNQLMQGLARWVVSAARQGEPYRGEEGEVHARQQPGCLWVGRTATFRPLTEDEEAEMCQAEGVPFGTFRDETTLDEKGHIAMFLDFTERRVCRDDV